MYFCQVGWEPDTTLRVIYGFGTASVKWARQIINSELSIYRQAGSMQPTGFLFAAHESNLPFPKIIANAVEETLRRVVTEIFH
jgi:hypothetical protein